MPKNKELSIRMRLKDEATKRLKGIQAHFRRFSASIKKMGAAFLKVGIALAAVTAAAVFALKKIVSTGMTYGLQLDKIAKQTAMTTEEFAKLSYAAEQEHASVESLTKVVPILAKYMEYARQGMETYSREFDKMGVSVTNGRGELKSTYEVLLEMAEYYKTAKNKTQALAIATTLLGRRGAELIPVLKLGKDGIKALGQEAEQLGIVLTGKTAAAMKELDNKVTEAKKAWQGIQIQLTVFLLPALREVTELITKDIKAVVLWISKLKDNEKAIEGVKDAFVKGYEAAQEFAIFLLIGAGQAVDAINELSLAVNSVVLEWLKMKRAVDSTEFKSPYYREMIEASEEFKGKIKELEEAQTRLADRAQVDWSEKIASAINKVKQVLGETREEFAKIKEELRDPFQIPQEVLDQMKELTKPTFGDNAKQVWADFYGGIGLGIENAKVSFSSFKDSVTNGTTQLINSMKTMWSDFIYNSFIGELDDAKKAFESFGKTVLRIIANIISEWVTIRIITGIGSLFAAGAGAGAGTARGAGAAGGAGVTAVAHQGGFVDWGGAIKAHSGVYLAPDEVPIIAQTGEGVLSRRGMSALGQLNRGQGGEAGNTYNFNMTIVANDEKSFRDKLAQNKDIYVNAATDSIERNGLLRGVIKKHTK